MPAETDGLRTRMGTRVVGIALALLLLALGAMGLGGSFAPDHEAVRAVRAAVSPPLAAVAGSEAAARRWLEMLEEPLAGALAIAAAVLLSVSCLGPRGSRVVESTAAGPLAKSDPRLARKAEKRAAALARRGQLAEAAELCLESGLLDRAAELYERSGQWVRAAEIHHDRNRLAEAAELYLRAGQHEAAGTIYAAQKDPSRAAGCYFQAGRMSVAAEMYEQAGEHRRAAECYADCGFHRYAAQAFVRAQDWGRAARSLEAVVEEEGSRVGSGQDPAKEADLRRLVLQAGRLYDQAGDLEAAQRVLQRGGCHAAAGDIALRRERYEEAAELFQRAGDAPRAAEALRQLGEDRAAAQILGEYHRERGEDDEAARLLLEAGDFGAAGDLYRTLEDPKRAGECYAHNGDWGQAAEMFRLAGDLGHAAAAYERVERWEEAAECAAHLGDGAREAACLVQAGLLLRAGEVYLREGLEDEAIKVLQQVPGPGHEFSSASALLGEIFRVKGKHTLAVKKLRQAIGDSELDVSNIDLFYSLGNLYELAGEPREAVEVYEKILAADYHYKDVETRLEAARTLVRELPSADSAAATGASISAQTRPARYRILGELGRGGMGIVYKAQDTVLDRPVAFKVLPDALKDNPQALANFLREAKSAAKLNHPNIVTVYDAGEQDGRYYIAMEYVDGTTLKQIVRRRGAVAPMGVLHVMIQMCDALEFAHRHKVVHRDIKTANTMWTRDRKAKIMDFGLAKVVEEVRNHTTLVSGTPYYMSPEQTLGKNVDHRTDIYSLGVTLFELATGTLPFREGNVPYHHVHTPAPDPRQVRSDVPAFLAGIISRCLKKAPPERFQSAGEIAASGRAALARLGRPKSAG